MILRYFFWGGVTEFWAADILGRFWAFESGWATNAFLNISPLGIRLSFMNLLYEFSRLHQGWTDKIKTHRIHAS